MKKLPIFLILLFLAACTSAENRVITSQTIMIPGISDSMFECPITEQWPNPDELTDLDVARLIVELRRNNLVCKNSIDAIQEFLRRAQDITSSPQ
jgi:hypothetical protein